MNRLDAFAGRCVRNGVDIFPRPYFGEKYRGKKANEKRCERRPLESFENMFSSRYDESLIER